MPIDSTVDTSNQDDDYESDDFATDNSGYNSGYNAPPYAFAANLGRLGYALARSHAQAAVGVSQIVGGVLTSLIDAANVSAMPFHPNAGPAPYDDTRGRERDRGPAPRSARDDDGRDRPRQRRYSGPADAANVVNDGMNRAVADALQTFSRAAEDFAQSYAPSGPRRSAPDRSAPDRDEPPRRARATREEVRRTGEHVADTVANAAARVENKTK
jgi:hypothetical protein